MKAWMIALLFTAIVFFAIAGVFGTWTLLIIIAGFIIVVVTTES